MPAPRGAKVYGASAAMRQQEFWVSRASGVVLVLSGLAVGAYGLLDSKNAGHAKGADRIIDAPARPVMARPASNEVAFSAPAVVVTIATHPNALKALGQNVAIPKGRDALTRALQEELRRVGCYDGKVNGAWTPTTRRAMKAFIDRVNATLPIEQPDQILYVMVKGKRAQVCGVPCPTGQSFGEDGRCLPEGILAKVKNNVLAATAEPSWKPTLQPTGNLGVITAWSPTSTGGLGATQPLTSAPVDVRMALAGPMSPVATPDRGMPPAAGSRIARVYKAPRLRRASGARGRSNASRAVFASNRSPN